MPVVWAVDTRLLWGVISQLLCAARPHSVIPAREVTCRSSCDFRAPGDFSVTLLSDISIQLGPRQLEFSASSGPRAGLPGGLKPLPFFSPLPSTLYTLPLSQVMSKAPPATLEEVLRIVSKGTGD